MKKLYFVNAFVDYGVIGGVSIAAWALLAGFHSGERTETVYGLAAALLWVCNWPHFSATSYRLYHSAENIRQYPMTALGVPAIVLAAVAGALASPEVLAPYFVKVFAIWSPYHFSGQTVGLCLLYARRAGVRFEALERLALSGFVFGTFLTATVRAETSPSGTTYYGIAYPGMGLPGWTVTVVEIWTGLCALGLLAAAVRISRARGGPLPPIVLLPAAAQYVWFVSGSGVASFAEFVPFFHSAQYLLIAWSMQLKERLDREGLSPSESYVLGESLRWGGMNIAGGAALFWLFPRVVAWCGFPLEFATGIAIAGVQIHHFFVDGVIWKLRSPAVSSPLMSNLDELLGREREAQAA
ncbi:MAG: hypothetical protein HY816_05230 [Candidatus Wallbacteria bacterium]|nr:hypothetical protein [Candidatus Wallbacteria bacterium]